MFEKTRASVRQQLVNLGLFKGKKAAPAQPKPKRKKKAATASAAVISQQPVDEEEIAKRIDPSFRSMLEMQAAKLRSAGLIEQLQLSWLISQVRYLGLCSLTDLN